MSRLKLVLAISAVLALLSGALLAADIVGPAPTNVVLEGLIASIDSQNGSITLVSYVKAPVTFFVVDATRIAKNGQPASFSALAVGDACRAEVQKTAEGTLVALNVQAKSPGEVKPPQFAVLEGRISAIDLQKGAVTLVAPERPAATFLVSDATKIFRNGQPVPLSALVIGDICRAEVQKTAEGAVVAINVQAKTAGDVKPPLNIVFEGRIAAIDLEKGSILLAPPLPEKPAVTIFVSDGTKIFRNGQPVALSALVVGDGCRAEVRKTDAGVFVALNIQAKAVGEVVPPKGIIIEGTISAIDQQNGSITLVNLPKASTRTDVTFFVTDGTKFFKNGQVATFSALVVGDRCRVEARQTENGALVAYNVQARTPEVQTIRK